MHPETSIFYGLKYVPPARASPSAGGIVTGIPMAKHPTARRVHRAGNDEDSFISGVLQSSVWAKQNGRALLFGGIAVLVVLVGLIYVRSLGASKDTNANNDITAIRATVQTGNVQLARQDLESFIKKYGDTGPGAEAKLMLAQIQLESNQPKEAISTLRDLAGDPKAPSGYSAALLLGAAYEADNQPKQAEDLYLNTAGKAPYEFQKVQALDRAARVRLSSNNPQGAAEIYERILGMFESDDPARNEFEMRLAEIRAPGSAATTQS